MSECAYKCGIPNTVTAAAELLEAPNAVKAAATISWSPRQLLMSLEQNLYPFLHLISLSTTVA